MFYENHAIYHAHNEPITDTEDAFNIASIIDGMDMSILKNHGTITCSVDIELAVMSIVTIERVYRLNFVSMSISDELNLVDKDTTEFTREWIGNGIEFGIEFNAFLRKVERTYPDFKKFRPKA